MMMRILLALVPLCFAACGGGEEEAGDPDFQRHLAKPLLLNKVFTDSLTYDGGDRSDWKVFNVDKPGLLTVTFHFDAGDGCEAYLADKYGAKIAKEVQSANPYLKLVRRVEPQRYFIWINSPSAACSTQYSVEARLDPD